MSNNIRCGSSDCYKIIPKHLRYITCFDCEQYFHVRCCNVNKKEFDSLKDSGENWLCQKCRPKELSVKCGSCKKVIPKNKVIIHCSTCQKYFHSKCSKISFQSFELLKSWTSDSCITNMLPFASVENEDLAIAMQARELKFGDHVTLNPSFTIRSLLGKIGGNWENEDYVYDLTHSKYYTTSEFLASKLPK